MATKRKRTSEITEEQHERIVELRLNRIPVRTVAEQVGVAPNTVTAHWRKYLNELTAERTERLSEKQSEVIARLDDVARMHRQGALRARSDERLDPVERQRAEARHLAGERQALKDMAGVAGYNAPIRVATTIGHEMTEAEAERILAEFGP